MPKFPVTVDGQAVEIQEFSDEDQIIVAIDERTYRVRFDGSLHYFMIKVGKSQQSVRGTLDQVRSAIVKVHLIYREYDRRCRRLKEDAQNARDSALQKVIRGNQ